MTERELSQAVHLKAELDALRRVAAEESSEAVLRAIDAQARAVEAARLEAMAQAWDVGNALKYLLRAGRKDALDIELGKAENYLHHALTGEWLEYRMKGEE